MSTPTQWFKRIRQVLKLGRHDVVEIMQLGGVEITASEADGWSRQSRDDRSREITTKQFDRFTFGLVEWSKRRP